MLRKVTDLASRSPQKMYVIVLHVCLLPLFFLSLHSPESKIEEHNKAEVHGHGLNRSYR